jgi:hypothetical protein
MINKEMDLIIIKQMQLDLDNILNPLTETKISFFVLSNMTILFLLLYINSTSLSYLWIINNLKNNINYLFKIKL